MMSASATQGGNNKRSDNIGARDMERRVCIQVNYVDSVSSSSKHCNWVVYPSRSEKKVLHYNILILQPNHIS